MTEPHAIARRNKANAQHSTGPKSAEGKKRASMNARTHGATARPKTYQVAQWLSIILNKAPITETDLEPNTHLGRCALELAKAEARLAATETSRRERVMTRRTSASLSALIDDLDKGMDIIFSSEEENTDEDICDAAAALEATLAALEADRFRLTWRYEREAQAARRRALKAWIAALAEVQSTNYQNEPKNAWHSPKRSQRQ